MGEHKIEQDHSIIHTFASGFAAKSVDLFPFGQILDRMRVQIQANPEVSATRSIIDLTRKGPSAFTKGLRWNIGSICMKGAFHWTVNDQTSRFVIKILPKEYEKTHPLTRSAMIGISAGLIETTAWVCPLSNLKVREMTHQWQGRVQMWPILKKEGPGMLFRGWNKIALRLCTTWTTYLVAYQKYKQIAEKRVDNPGVKTKALVGAATGMTAASLHAPFEFLAVQAQKENPQKIRGIIPALFASIQQYGFKGVYRSLPIKLIRSGWYSVSTLLVMDYLKALPQHMRFKNDNDRK